MHYLFLPSSLCSAESKVYVYYERQLGSFSVHSPYDNKLTSCLSPSQKASLEETLSETHSCFAAQLASLQEMVSSLEVQLSQIHSDIYSNQQEFTILLEVKTRLEKEIAEYRRLLEGEDER